VQPLQTPMLTIFCPCASVDPVVAETSSCLPLTTAEHKLKTKEYDLPACNHFKVSEDLRAQGGRSLSDAPWP
jgi:hypothetical protein